MTKICACLMIAALLFCCLFAACTPKNDANEALKDTLKIEILKSARLIAALLPTEQHPLLLIAEKRMTVRRFRQLWMRSESAALIT